MDRQKQVSPDTDAARYLPELRAWARKQYMPAPAGISYSEPPASGKNPCSVAEPAELPDSGGMPFSPGEVKRDMSLLDSPAMLRYYHSWEKEQSAGGTFSSEVTRMVAERYRKASDFYLPAGIDKRTFHRIRRDYLYRPSRVTAVKCCLGLRLDREQAEKLMGLAGYAFSRSDPADLVVLFCLEKEIWDLASVNYLMDAFDLKDLDGYTGA